MYTVLYARQSAAGKGAMSLASQAASAGRGLFVGLLCGAGLYATLHHRVWEDVRRQELQLARVRDMVAGNRGQEVVYRHHMVRLWATVEVYVCVCVHACF